MNNAAYSVHKTKTYKMAYKEMILISRNFLISFQNEKLAGLFDAICSSVQILISCWVRSLYDVCYVVCEFEVILINETSTTSFSSRFLGIIVIIFFLGMNFSITCLCGKLGMNVCALKQIHRFADKNLKLCIMVSGIKFNYRVAPQSKLSKGYWICKEEYFGELCV